MCPETGKCIYNFGGATVGLENKVGYSSVDLLSLAQLHCITIFHRAVEDEFATAFDPVACRKPSLDKVTI